MNREENGLLPLGADMVLNKPLTLFFTSNPPRAIIPTLVEWWLTLRKCNPLYQHASISQIESAYIEDSDVVFSSYVSTFMGEKVPQTRLTSPWTICIFVDNKEPVQTMILSASSKTGMIVYIAEDVKGDPIIDPLTGAPKEETIHSDNILIYSCLPISIPRSAEAGKEIDWCSVTPLDTIL